ncbi:MAG: T9SS type A sorting domain-containing protein, partial [Muribaculaceae bacterium]|nr:T9SS type A sorting domain-containing protein [Muribaculaceae bacterium]
NFAMGANWMKSLSLLALTGETYNIYAESTELRLSDSNNHDGAPAIAVFHLDRLYADKVEITLDSTCAELGEITVSADGYTIECEVYCLGNGVAELIATLGDKKAVIQLSTSSAAIDALAPAASTITYDGTVVTAEAEISIYNISGICVARGNGEVSTANLPNGIYIATNGTESIKIKK